LTILHPKGKLPHCLLASRENPQAGRYNAASKLVDRRDLSTFKIAGKRVSYTLDSTLESVNRAEETATQVATDAGFDEEEVPRISMAVREAAVNAVLHGNAYDPNKKVGLAFERTARALVITITDQGKGLDPSSVPDPLAPENLLKVSGRGIFLIRAFMDDVQIRALHPGTELKMSKQVPGSAGDKKEESQ
jgi:serine/threonine-protein kinase RsbW